MAEVTEIIEGKVKVKFNQDDVPSALEYPKLISYAPKVGDKVLMLKTNTSYICLGGIGAEAEGQKEDTNIVGEYKFFAKDKGLLWKGWARCDGRELSATTYPELYTEIGNTFGGSGNNFNLPDTTGRVLSDASGKAVGGKEGTDTVTLATNQIPSHSHTVSDSGHSHSQYFAKLNESATVNGASVVGGYGEGSIINYSGRAQIVKSATGITLSNTGGGQSHENRQPTLYGGYYYIYTGVMG